ncbi:multiple epidermal growth factor-like domains protein 10 isoform X2 [Mytilus edulis]|uniref:multiple epidermal growth factor-like domains protein 10 isoform X2 n=1 Tax=Mytilus edulis TaxID=6550 RepID=UPI0039EE1D27
MMHRWKLCKMSNIVYFGTLLLLVCVLCLPCNATVSTTACTTDYDCEQIHVHMYGYECDRSVGYYRCQERYFEVGDICQQRGDNGNPCNSSIANSCFHPGELICNSGNICSCSDTNTHYWKASTFSCTPRGNNRGDCDNNIDHSCLYPGQLICTSGNTCECFDEFSNYWKASTSTCTPKGHNGGDCTSGITDSCIYSEQLVCKSDNKCSCPDTSTHYWNDYSCTPTCTAGTFGNKCFWNCSQNCLSSPCNHVTGVCDGGCNRGWETLNCTEKCSQGTFGWNCSGKCNGCTEDSCDYISGVCTNISGCKPGYEYGRYCNKTCADWYFGTNCTNYCNCLEKPCNTFSGQCSTDGCKRGWDSVSCDKECTYGYFGFNCNGFCANCLNQSCSILDGNCTDGCSIGYSGDMCDIKGCPYRRYGDKCEHVCSENCLGQGQCDLVSGNCLSGCSDGWVGEKCDQESRQAMDNSHSNSNEQHYDDIIKMEGLSTYQDLTKQTVTVSNDYDQINHSYINQ